MAGREQAEDRATRDARISGTGREMHEEPGVAAGVRSQPGRAALRKVTRAEFERSPVSGVAELWFILTVPVYIAA